MPIYEFRCECCGHRFSRFFRTMRGSEEDAPQPCPACQSDNIRRLVSSFAVGGGSASDTETTRESSDTTRRAASITPKEQIDRWRSGSKR